MKLLVGLAIFLCLCAPIFSDPILTGDTNIPAYSVFYEGQEVILTFTVNNASSRAWLNLELSYLNEYDNLMSKTIQFIICDTTGYWSGNITPPTFFQYGFVRVMADVTSPGSGVYYYLSPQGSRVQQGYITYAIVPNPLLRPLFPPSKTRFAMTGGFNAKTLTTMSLLGTRWYYGGYAWGTLEPDYPGQWNATVPYDDFTNFTNVDGTSWKSYFMPTPYQSQPKWAVNQTDKASMKPPLPSAESDWTNFMSNVAKHFSAKYPDMDERVYQITWETDQKSPSLWDAGNKALVRIYELCYDAIHAADSEALVAGPTLFPGELNNSISLESYNLSKYIDGFSMHAYTTEDFEESGFIQDLRAELNVFSAPKGISPHLPFYETEHGFGTRLDKALELRQARWLLKVTLVILGEGGKNSWNFYIHDFDSTAYGIFYSLALLNTGEWVNYFGNPKLAPKPAVPVLSAASWLLDGCDGQGFFNDTQTRFSEYQIGYLFTCDHDQSTVRVVWDYRIGSNINIYANYTKGTIYDWMGNGQNITSQADASGLSYFAVLAKNEPVYLKIFNTDVIVPTNPPTSSPTSSSSPSSSTTGSQNITPSNASTHFASFFILFSFLLFHFL